MADMTPDEKKAFIADWLKPQSIIAVLGFVIVIGMGWQRLQSLEYRVEAIEGRERDSRDILMEIRTDLKALKEKTFPRP
jgi:hypothetical protein